MRGERGRSVPIYRLFKGQAFEPQHVQAMADAFEGVLRELGLKDRNDPLCEIVAKTIIELGQQGVREPAELASLAMRTLKG